ncbi:hypothetical protein EKN56_00705 [Limnobaculum zhutongyuii]|uniref:Surface-adhesin protein E-like domain-containing protein n=1 Tax=Limnobaculum zhutongyuii TaxID=2498113 RepID=A0A411WG89_9GAMM|nr:surface-adhesin E family protein [Limnobaculum zhutongyuii]QBH95066.1 hypothetical protein EKN56_00705 [Limnobaculum zhutongyuii]TQS87592.1 hypothetical protein ELQ32_13215 [Limnobaculum zhutongyuii]
MKNKLIKLLVFSVALITAGCANDNFDEQELTFLNSDGERDIYLSKVNHTYNDNPVLSYFYYIQHYEEPKEVGGKEIGSSKSIFLFDCSIKNKFSLFPPVLYTTEYATGEPAYSLNLPGQWTIGETDDNLAGTLWKAACTEKYKELNPS